MKGYLCMGALAIGALLYYCSSCLFWPYGKCLRCDGGGKKKAMWGGGFRMCGRCSGGGRRLRIGRRIFNYLSRKASP